MIIDYLLNNLPTIILSVLALIVSVRSWYKTRAYYDLDMYQITGYGSEGNLNKIKEKLNTGKYTIVNTSEETHPGNRNTLYILLGKIKK